MNENKTAKTPADGEPVIGTKTWFEDGNVVTQNLYASDIYKDPPKQPEQEPKFGACVTCGALLEDQIIKQTPKREWVGLTEDEFEKILERHNEAFPFAVYQVIEAKLKEKNGYE